MFRTYSLALRSLLARPSRTFLTVFAIVLGVAVILAISITNFSTLDSIGNVFSEASGKAQLVIISADTSGQGFSEDLLHRLNLPGIKVAVPSMQAQTMLATEDAPPRLDISMFGAVPGGLLIYGVDPALDAQVREYKMVAGHFISQMNSRDIVLVKDYADKKKISIGDDIAIVTPDGHEKVRVIGLITNEGPGQLNNGAFGVIPLETAQKLFSRPGDLDEIAIVALSQSASGKGLDELQAALQDRVGDRYTVVYPAARGRRVTQMLDGYQIGLNFFSAIALFVGAFLIYNAFSMTVIERTREIGMLRTLGMTRRQVMAQILAEATMLGCLGSALGVLTGILLAQGLIRATELLLAQEIRQIHIPTDGLALSVIVGIVVTLVAAVIPASQASRISPLEALRVRGNLRENWIVRNGWSVGLALVFLTFIVLNQIKLPPTLEFYVSNISVMGMFVGATLLVPICVTMLERVSRPWIWRIYGGEGQLGSRNTERARFRTALTVAALMISVAMIISVRALSSSFGQDLREWINVYIGGDLYAHSTVPLAADLGNRLATIDGIAAVAGVRFLDIKHVKEDGTDENIIFSAVEPDIYKQVTSFVFAGNQGDPDRLLEQLGAGGSVFVSSVLSEKHGIKKGDQIILETRRGRLPFRVAAIVVDFNNQGFVVSGSWKDMRRYFGVNEASAFLIKLKPNVSQSQMREQIVDQYGKRFHITVESNQALKERALNLTSQAVGLFDVLALIAVIVAALGVVNTMTMSVMERTREIGMLRSLGMTKWQVGKMILAEAMMMGVIGATFGLVFGIFQSRILLVSVNTMAGYDLTYVTPTQGIVIGLIVAIVISQLAALWPARRATGLRIIDSIQFE